MQVLCEVACRFSPHSSPELHSPCGEMVNASQISEDVEIEIDVELHSPCGEMVNARDFVDKIEKVIHNSCIPLAGKW